VHLRWRYVGLVALGGFIGTLLRDIVSMLYPVDAG
jgi:fluoride exporter